MSDNPLDLDRLIRESRVEHPLAYRHYLQTGVTPRLPRHITLETAAACQLACPMCDRANMRRERLLMSDQTYNAVLDRVAPHRVKIGFNGIGEPLLDKKLPERIAQARSRGIPETAMASNGLLLEPRLARELIKAGLTRAVIALDGPDPASQYVGHLGADPEQVAENLEGLLAARRELGAEDFQILIRVTVQRGNLATLPDIYRRWHGRVTHIQVNLVYQYGQVSTDPLMPVHWGSRIPCPQTRDSLLVLTNGDATICCLGDINAELAVGNLTRDSLEHCFSGPRARAIRELHRAGDLSSLPVCQRCGAATQGNFQAGALARALEAECLAMLERGRK
jgi:sulfatase maturation enzyme AslB (radical SAM superfamily)